MIHAIVGDALVLSAVVAIDQCGVCDGQFTVLYSWVFDRPIIILINVHFFNIFLNSKALLCIIFQIVFSIFFVTFNIHILQCVSLSNHFVTLII